MAGLALLQNTKQIRLLDIDHVSQHTQPVAKVLRLCVGLGVCWAEKSMRDSLPATSLLDAIQPVQRSRERLSPFGRNISGTLDVPEALLSNFSRFCRHGST